MHVGVSVVEKSLTHLPQLPYRHAGLVCSRAGQGDGLNRDESRRYYPDDALVDNLAASFSSDSLLQRH